MDFEAKMQLAAEREREPVELRQARALEQIADEMTETRMVLTQMMESLRLLASARS